MSRDKYGYRFNNLHLRSQRAIAEKTQRQIAAEAGVAVQIVTGWETGRNIPETMRLPVIAEIYGCSIDDLFVPSE
jgi:transcriptional regulator with XRE-family HTH domain